MKYENEEDRKEKDAKMKCWQSKMTTSEKIYEKGLDRTERSLDVRNLIKNQMIMKSLLISMVP